MTRESKHGWGRSWRTLLVMALLGGGVVFALSGCLGKKKMNVVIITMDTTRVDHLRCYGYDRIETPNLVKIAKEGVQFDRAYSHIPLTLPAHTCILSGTVPFYNGVKDNGAYRVPDKLVTLAEVLKDHGYHTGGFVSAAVLKKTFNLNQGFEHWDEENLQKQGDQNTMVSDRKANVTTDAALGWLNSLSDGPFFIWIHYYDPHQQYDPPDPYNLLYPDKYDGEIAFMDSQIGRVYDWLKDQGKLDQTLLVALADHGEGLGEHHESTHAYFIYNGTQHIPMLMRLPGFAEPGKKIEAVVGQKDVMPTILDYLGLPIPDDVIGESLRPIISEPPGQETPQRFVTMESAFGFFHYGWAPLTGLVGPRYKFIKAPTPELYDMIADSHEMHNLAEDQDRVANQYRTRLQGFEKKWGKGLRSEEADIPEDLQIQLADLGYIVGGFKGDLNKALKKDPKNYAEIIPYLSTIQGVRERNRYPQLLKMCDKILAKDSSNALALGFKGDALLGLGRFDEAIASYQKLLDEDYTAAGANLKIAIVYVRMGGAKLSEGDRATAAEDYGKARKHLEQAIAEEENSPMAYYYLGRLDMIAGDDAGAMTNFTNNYVADTQYGHLGLALLYAQQGRPMLADAEFEQVKALAGDDSGEYWQEYANYLVSQGRYAEAKENMDKVVENDPGVKLDPGAARLIERIDEGLANSAAGSTAEPLSGATAASPAAGGTAH